MSVYGIDTGHSLSQTNCERLIQAGKSFAVRYYSNPDNPDQAWKIISRAEAQRILDSGLKLCMVYQDEAGSQSCFSREKGFQAIQNAITLAEEIGQPYGSAIYFAVDYDAGGIALGNNIMPYFDAINEYLNECGNPYKVGVYGSGFICSRVKSIGFASYTWLSMSTGWAEYSTYNTPSKYNIKQVEGAVIDGVLVDLDVTGNASEYGAFSSLRN